MSRVSATDAEIRRGRRLGVALQALRERQGLTQAALAQLAGLSVDTVRKIEQGRTPTPSVFVVAGLASGLHITVETLIRRANADD